MYIYKYIYTYIYIYIICQGRAVRDMRRGPDQPEGESISRRLLDLSARAGLNTCPYKTSLRSELGSPNISEKI